MKSTLAAVSVLGLLVAGTTARAESNPFAEPSPAAAPAGTGERPGRWGVSSSIGVGSAKGDFSSILKTPISGELNIFRVKGPWRFGFGVSLGSMRMREPYDHEDEWGFLQTYLSATRMLRNEGSFRPYLQVRGGLARLHPRSHLFDQSPLPEGFKIGDSPTKATNGFSVAAVPGFEWRLNRSVALDLSASFGYFSVSDYDLSPVGLAPAGSGTFFEGRFGVRWTPDNGYPSGVRPSVPQDAPRDAWGISRNYGWAAAEVLGINLGAAAFNEYIRTANFNQTSPRSWWRNIKEGFTYDGDDFRNNQFAHSYNGSQYFNAAQANGLNFWTSAAYAMFGAFFWECCGETHPIAFNDLISTGIGGIALGEMEYRLSSEILDNQAKGRTRFFKELSAFLVDPIRGLNRQFSGRARQQGPNPEDPLDWRPPHGSSLLGLGARIIGQGESISENTKTYANFEFVHAYGSPFDNHRRKPFDYFDTVVQFSGQEKVPMNIVRVRGDLWQKPLGDAEAPNHVFAISQFYEYMNNTAYEFGGQAVAATLHSRYRLSDKVGLTTRFDGIAQILGAINSDYAKIADVGDRERLREYDFGPGLGADGEATLIVSGRPWLWLLYRFQWISVSNGSVYVKGKSEGGTDANHYVQAAGARFVVPIFGRLGLGADGSVFLRKSRYSDPRFHDVDQRNPQVRIYVALNSAR